MFSLDLFSCLLIFQTSSCCVTQTGPKLSTGLLLPPPEGWGYRCAPPQQHLFEKVLFHRFLLLDIGISVKQSLHNVTFNSMLQFFSNVLALKGGSSQNLKTAKRFFVK